MEKGIPALMSFWGIVYAGGFYVFLNPELPVARLRQMQQVLGARRVITDRAHAETARNFSQRKRFALWKSAGKRRYRKMRYRRLKPG